MNIFVTGATGFIGYHLVKRLTEEGHIVHAIYRTKSKIENMNFENIKWFQANILDIESLEKAMKGCDQAYHVAAYANAWENNPGDFTKYNVQGTVNVLNTAQSIGINNIVVTSTAGVVGPSLNNMINENSKPSVPYFTRYEQSKAEAERLIDDRTKHGARIIIVNPTRVFGPGILSESNSVTKMIKKYLDGKWHILPGNGESIGNYVYVDDVVNGHILAMQKGKTGERYILGGENISYKQLFNIIDKITGKEYRLICIPLPFMLGFAYSLIFINKLTGIKPIITPAHVRKFNYNWNISNDKAINEIGYKITPFEEGVRETINWLSSKSFNMSKIS